MATLSAPALAEPAMWRVHSATTDITLFGTVHALPPGTNWLSPRIAARIDAADTLVLETILPDDPAGLGPLVTALGVKPGLPPLAARVAPSKGTFESAVFAITGPGLGSGVTINAHSPSPGVFKASFAFLEGGRFDVTFATQAEGKPLKAARTLVAGDAPKPPDPQPGPGPKPPTPAPSSSVKWM